ncbi:hypothetical protein [Actinomadura sp. NPDC049753]|uniref:methyltransferase family protein n=1 Tax=Actinomadura sp. NPDC049753 TaxID=3154739 RepID=UPI00341C030A
MPRARSLRWPGSPPPPALEHTAVHAAGTAQALAGVAGALAGTSIFTTVIATAAGLAAMVPNAIALFGLVLTVVAVQMQVRAVEEPYLLHAHGDAYAAYAAEVGWFLPGVGRLTSSRGAQR